MNYFLISIIEQKFELIPPSCRLLVEHRDRRHGTTQPYGPGFGPERRWFSVRAYTLVPSFGSVESAAVPVSDRARSTLGERTVVVPCFSSVLRAPDDARRAPAAEPRRVMQLREAVTSRSLPSSPSSVAASLLTRPISCARPRQPKVGLLAALLSSGPFKARQDRCVRARECQ